jgi:hypothetical protein
MALVRMDLGGRVRGPRRNKEELLVIESSGNVFADIGLPEPEEELAKAELASYIGAVIRPAVPKPVSRPRDDIAIVIAFVVVILSIFGLGFTAATVLLVR